MGKEYFVRKDSIVRRIWGKSDTILFIFAGAAAEFALNKAVDWLYFTGRLPADPLGRLFSTVSYARTIVFAEKHVAHRAIESMNTIHAAVESKRGGSIPPEAYRDVLFMLIDYSIRAFELLERNLTDSEKTEVFNVFNRVGEGMGIPGLPETFQAWESMRKEHLLSNLKRCSLTDDLFKQYRKHLGTIRYRILREGQSLVIPDHVRKLLGMRISLLIKPLIAIYKLTRHIRIDRLLKVFILPADYKEQIRLLDRKPA